MTSPLCGVFFNESMFSSNGILSSNLVQIELNQVNSTPQISIHRNKILIRNKGLIYHTGQKPFY